MKTINIVLFGIGNVGSTLIKQINKAKAQLNRKQKIDLKIVIAANSKTALYNKNGIANNWETNYTDAAKQYTIKDILDYTKAHKFHNLIAIDATASTSFVQNYIRLAQNGFNIISANKVANTLHYDFYDALRSALKSSNKTFLYETNVGAGLPVIETIKNLHESGERIDKIRGVFSGSLSYIFNTFSEGETPFSTILKEAMTKGFTEPDPREDLSGNDVGRKLLILARELDLCNEFFDIQIQNLIPEVLRKGDVKDFFEHTEILDDTYSEIKKVQEPGHVLRYVGDLHGDLQQEKGILEVKLVSVPKESAMGQVKGSDSIIEIYTESYGEDPLVIQGAGAGAAVTARGVFGDILRIADKG